MLVRYVPGRGLETCAPNVYALPDFPHATPEIRQEWIQYRQALRDITKTVELSEDGLSVKILSVVWPAKPL